MSVPKLESLRIAVICEYPTLFGGERSMLSIERELSSLGCQLIWLVPNAGPLADELQRRGSRVIPFTIRDQQGRFLPDAIPLTSLSEIVQRTSPNVLHGNSLAMARWLGRHAIQFELPTTGHIRDIVGLSRSAVDEVNRNRRLIAVSQATRDFHVAQGVDEARVSVVYNGIDSATFAALPAGDVTLRDELRIPSDSLLIATIGQIGLRKGQTIFAEAAVTARQIRGSVGRPLHFLLIGERYSTKDESAAFDTQIDETIRGADMQLCFHRLGYRNDVPDILRQIDVVVHPARQEPLGRVLLEAAAAGRAIIATDVGGTREILSHDHSALLVKSDDAEAMAQNIVRLCQDDSLRQHLGTNAFKAVCSRFTIQQCALGCLEAWKCVANVGRN